MKYLEIKDNKGYFWNGTKMVEVDQIDKDGILTLLNAAEKDDFELDEYDAELLGNKAHQIIYENIYKKFEQFLKDRQAFKKQVDSLYTDAIRKYSANLEEEDIDSIIDIEEGNSDNDVIDPDDLPF